MGKLFIIVLLMIAFPLLGQDTTRGLSIPQNHKENTGTTRALVVGISDYQDLPKLQYADKDAIDFAYFLTHNKGWQLAENNVRLLTNDKARAGDIITGLNWLLQNSRAGDNVMFYFSGHGDVETTNDAGKGYLLAWDTPKNNYVTGGLSVSLLQALYSGMIDKGVKVYIITDACRAGHLAGGANGSKLTAEAFSKQWRNEVKILSAQPDEFSYEGSQWGGGRGVFSFFLTKGLNGYADIIKKDSIITLAELEMYVGLQVSQETGYKQQPIFEGSNKYSNSIARLDGEGMNRYSQYKNNDIAVLVVKEKGRDIDAGKCKVLFDSFKTYLNDAGSKASRNKAWNAYIDLCFCALQENFHSPVDNNIADIAGNQLNAAYLNYVQQVVNQTLIGKKLVTARQLQDAVDLVHWIKEINKNKPIVNAAHLDNIRRYLEINKDIFWSDGGLTTERDEALRQMLDTALAVEPGAAYLELMKGVFFSRDEQYDSAMIYFKKAIAHSPTWLMAYYYAGLAMEEQKNAPGAIAYFQKAMSLDTAYRTFECAECFYAELGGLFTAAKQYDSALHYYSKAAVAYNSPAVFAMIEIYHQQKQLKERNKWLQLLKDSSKAVKEQLDLLDLQMELGLADQKTSRHLLDSLEYEAPEQDKAYANYVWTRWCRHFGRDALPYAEQAYSYSPNDFDYIVAYVDALMERKQFPEAEKVIQAVSIKLKRSQQAELQVDLAACYTYTNREKQAFELYKTLVGEGWLTCKDIKHLKPLQKLPEYISLMKQCK